MCRVNVYRFSVGRRPEIRSFLYERAKRSNPARLKSFTQMRARTKAKCGLVVSRRYARISIQTLLKPSGLTQPRPSAVRAIYESPPRGRFVFFVPERFPGFF